MTAPPADRPKSGHRGEMADARDALHRPYRQQHEATTRDRFERHPQRLRDYIRELKDAVEAETVTRLHKGGVEWEPRRDDDSDSGGSKLGTPSWTAQFRAFITGPACSIDEEGEWRWPLRSSLFRLSVSRSGTDRLAAGFVFLLTRSDYSVRAAWARQCGVLADPAIADAAEAWAAESLRRWWELYVDLPR
jgi:hypothetical protein